MIFIAAITTAGTNSLALLRPMLALVLGGGFNHVPRERALPPQPGRG